MHGIRIKKIVQTFNFSQNFLEGYSHAALIDEPPLVVGFTSGGAPGTH
jgi:hypothetical protein